MTMRFVTHVVGYIEFALVRISSFKQTKGLDILPIIDLNKIFNEMMLNRITWIKIPEDVLISD